MIPLGLGLATILLAGVVAMMGAFRSHDPRGERAHRRAMLCRVLLGAGCTSGAVSAIRVLLGGPAIVVQFGTSGPVGPWIFGLDALSSVFLLAIFAVGAASACYGFTYLAPHAVDGAPDPAHTTNEPGSTRVAGSHALIALLIVMLALVVVARAVIPFL
ncbi:MAG TPA: hypothetical protein VIC55_07765, partial [Gemmatimonadaceae bacterium]